MWWDLVISQDFCLTAVLLQLSLYFLLVLQAPPPKSSPNLHKCTLTPDCPRKRELLAKGRQLAIAASRLAVSLAKKNFKKILWDQGSTNEPARRLGGLWRLRDFLYSHCFDSLIFSHGMQFLLSSTCKIHNTMLFSQAQFRQRYGTPENCFFQMSFYWTAEERSVQWGT